MAPVLGVPQSCHLTRVPISSTDGHQLPGLQGQSAGGRRRHGRHGLPQLRLQALHGSGVLLRQGRTEEPARAQHLTQQTLPNRDPSEGGTEEPARAQHLTQQTLPNGDRVRAGSIRLRI